MTPLLGPISSTPIKSIWKVSVALITHHHPLGTEGNKGVMIVKVTTLNGENGRNVSSDFIVNIHANDPFPDTFKGNASGTTVKLSMGMYSVTISSIPNYNSSFSSDCNGGIMKVETKNCNIIMTYIKSD